MPAPSRTRVNHQIRVPSVRVIGPDGAQLGVMATFEARRRADELGLDLVEVAPMERPPVCKILDYGKMKYDESRREKEARHKQKTVTWKEIRVEPDCAEHDLETKMNHTRRFLAEGNKVRVTLKFRGRKITHPERGRAVLARFSESVSDLGVAEQAPIMEGKLLFTSFAPRPQGRPAPRPSSPVPTVSTQTTAAA